MSGGAAPPQVNLSGRPYLTVNLFHSFLFFISFFFFIFFSLLFSFFFLFLYFSPEIRNKLKKKNNNENFFCKSPTLKNFTCSERQGLRPTPIPMLAFILTKTSL
ncbi:hypothetical protein KFK09_008885 [Dendrobium nobile]|uniref:Uncharacterized protein n=1 Tax=Dendrobium nobile TaxID=94219 RepID=A0A8T3BS56_DENNO|nr:hypothetical protein KFK09_008885 [Dendrobium nobile]